MKVEYEERINKILKTYYLSAQHGVSPTDYSIAMLSHSLHHLCGMAMCSGDIDIGTIEEIKALVTRVKSGDIPQYYNHSGLNLFSSMNENKTLCIKGPLAISIELTPELYKSLRDAIGG